MYTIRKPILITLIFGFASSSLTATLTFAPPAISQNAPVAVVSAAPNPIPFSIFSLQCVSPGCVRSFEPSPVAPTPQVKPSVPAPKTKSVPPTKVEPAPQVTSTNPRIQVVIAFALAQIGKRYQWAAAGPNAYDCSGLVMVAFSKIGLRLPHFTGALINLGKQVSKSGLQKGDIVFPSSGHVGIYLGDGKMVHAPQPGESVKVSIVYAFYSARRLVS